MGPAGPSGPKRIVILGSTGSIGRSTPDVIRTHPDRYGELRELLADTDVEVAAGEAAVAEQAARPADIVVAAIVGARGLKPTLAAIRAGTTVALANKECLVSGGELFMREAKATGA